MFGVLVSIVYLFFTYLKVFTKNIFNISFYHSVNPKIVLTAKNIYIFCKIFQV